MPAYNIWIKDANGSNHVCHTVATDNMDALELATLHCSRKGINPTNLELERV